MFYTLMNVNKYSLPFWIFIEILNSVIKPRRSWERGISYFNVINLLHFYLILTKIASKSMICQELSSQKHSSSTLLFSFYAYAKT